MHVLFQLAICVCLIIMAGGSIHYVHDHPSFGGGLLLIVIWSVLLKLIDHTDAFKFAKLNKKKTQVDGDATGERIVLLEKRLTDIQDIVIAIDEKLGRVESRSDSQIHSGDQIEQK